MASETSDAKMHEKEEVKVNVMEYQPNFRTSFWIRTILLRIILVPLKLFLFGISVVAVGLCALFVTYTGIGHVKSLGFNMVEWMFFVARLGLRSIFNWNGGFC